MTGRFLPDPWLRRWEGRVLAGGSPWRLLRVNAAASSMMDHAYRPGGLRDDEPADRPVIDALVDRGLLHPRPVARPGPHDVTVVVPAYGRPDALGRCLSCLSDVDVIVVDDATPESSPLRDIAAAAGAGYVRLPRNRGPAAARNAGLALTRSALVAFVDSDCQPPVGWLDHLVPFFDDPRVAVVAPRVVPSATDPSLLARFERASSTLDMGRHPAIVRPAARLGFVPSAALVVRRDVVRRYGFDEALRLGEDVDFVWRVADAGYHVRYEPGVVVGHEPRRGLRAWVSRRYEYGTSAVDLAARHPGRLAPVRASPWNLAALALLGVGQPAAALATSAVATGLLARRLHARGIGGAVATRVVAAGLAADAVTLGQALRREYWPLGALAVVAAPRSRRARLALGLMATPVLAEWMSGRPRLDPARYAALRLLADGGYGTGVLASSLRRRTALPLRPALRHQRQGRTAPRASTED